MSGSLLIYGDNVTKQSYLAARLLNIRGQESTGISRGGDPVEGDKPIKTYKGHGLVTDVLSPDLISNLSSPHHYAAIAHVKSSTVNKDQSNIEPIEIRDDEYMIALAMDGAILENPKEYGVDSRTELLGKIYFDSLKETGDPKEAARTVMQKLDKGYFSVVMLVSDSSETRAIAFRDKRGVRPLVRGSHNGVHFVASESFVFSHPVNAVLEGDIPPGGYFEISKAGMINEQLVPRQDKFCWFEYGYSSSRASVHNGVLVHWVRERVGRELFKKHRDQFRGKRLIIGPNPESGRGVTEGFINEAIKQQSELGMEVLYREYILKNPYAKRTYIIPDKKERELEGSLKFLTIADLVRDVLDSDAELIEGDDSIVRGTVQRKVVDNFAANLYIGDHKERDLDELKNEIRRKTHVVLGSPPLIKTCYDYLHEGNRSFIASKYAGLSADDISDAVAKELGLASVMYPSIETIVKATGLPADGFCLDCFTGKCIFDS